MKKIIAFSMGLVGLLSLPAFAEGELSLAQLAPKPAQPFRLCYISMNNANEFTAAKDFIQKVQDTLGVSGYVQVTEYMQEKADPQKVITDLVKSGQRCDGLVVSGHHTGAFGGPRAQGNLGIDFLSRVSCQANSKDWFSNINVLWLQGCRTLGATGEAQNNNGQNLALYNGQRVDRNAEQDGLTQGRYRMEDEFTSVLDTESPYAIRFIKAFSGAKIFGWTSTSPGEDSGSELSLPYHFANLARQLLEEKKISTVNLQSPTDARFTQFTAQAYLAAIVSMLSRNDHSQQAVGAWIEQGHATNVAKKSWGFANSNLNGYPPLYASENEGIKKAKDFDCRLWTSIWEKQREEAMKEIVSSEDNLKLSFYTVRDAIAAETSPSARYREIQDLQESPAFQSFILKKLNDPNVGTTRLADYLGLYSLAFNGVLSAQQQDILNQLLTFVSTDFSGTHEDHERFYAEADARLTVLRSLHQAKMVTNEMLIHIVQTAPSFETLQIVLWWVANYNVYPWNMDQLGNALFEKFKSLNARDEFAWLQLNSAVMVWPVTAMLQKSIVHYTLDNFLRTTDSMKRWNDADHKNFLSSMIPYYMHIPGILSDQELNQVLTDAYLGIYVSVQPYMNLELSSVSQMPEADRLKIYQDLHTNIQSAHNIFGAMVQRAKLLSNPDMLAVAKAYVGFELSLVAVANKLGSPYISYALENVLALQSEVAMLYPGNLNPPIQIPVSLNQALSMVRPRVDENGQPGPEYNAKYVSEALLPYFFNDIGGVANILKGYSKTQGDIALYKSVSLFPDSYLKDTLPFVEYQNLKTQIVETAIPLLESPQLDSRTRLRLVAQLLGEELSGDECQRMSAAALSGTRLDSPDDNNSKIIRIGRLLCPQAMPSSQYADSAFKEFLDSVKGNSEATTILLQIIKVRPSAFSSPLQTVLGVLDSDSYNPDAWATAFMIAHKNEISPMDHDLLMKNILARADFTPDAFMEIIGQRGDSGMKNMKPEEIQRLLRTLITQMPLNTSEKQWLRTYLLRVENWPIEVTSELMNLLGPATIPTGSELPQ